VRGLLSSGDCLGRNFKGLVLGVPAGTRESEDREAKEKEEEQGELFAHIPFYGLVPNTALELWT
jgi:hypothetical protein